MLCIRVMLLTSCSDFVLSFKRTKAIRALIFVCVATRLASGPTPVSV